MGVVGSCSGVVVVLWCSGEYRADMFVFTKFTNILIHLYIFF